MDQLEVNKIEVNKIEVNKIEVNKIEVRRIALLGFGTVGGGVYKTMLLQKDELPFKIGAEIEIGKILVRDAKKPRAGAPAELFCDDWSEIISDKSIDIVVEVMGGIEPARSYIAEALRAGKHVVTANKDLMAVHGHELLEIATENNCDLLFEAAVAGGIPIIRPLKQCLAGNHISEVMGIINGTTNFILTKMTKDSMEFEDALALATELGYAEADPTADIEGYDAGRKLAILASIAFNTPVKFADVFTEGISQIKTKDIHYANELGCTIKLLGIAKNTPTGIEVRVHPTLIPSEHPLAVVNDAFNAIFVHGDAIDDAMFYGRGAGEMPTASAIMGDIIDVARNIQFHCNGRIACTCFKELNIKKHDEMHSGYYIRMQLEDRAGTLAGIAGVFGSNNVSISKLLQKTKENDVAEVVVITEPVVGGMFQDALTVLSHMSMVRKISSVIRVY